MTFVNDKLYSVRSRTEARSILEKLARIAKDYGVASIADLKDICGINSCYSDNKNGWVYSGVQAAQIWESDTDYMIAFPRSAPLGTDAHDFAPKSTPKSFTINIDTAKMDDVDTILADIFKYAYTITDREVIVNIT